MDMGCDTHGVLGIAATSGSASAIGSVDLRGVPVVPRSRPLIHDAARTRSAEAADGPGAWTAWIAALSEGDVSVLFDSFIALVLLLVCAPACLAIACVSLLAQGRPILYAGIRLGKGKRRFKMYKFRTLSVDAEQRLGAQLVAEAHQVVTPFGRFLRETRLDELPQLINVIRGDMALLGPRPERMAVYAEQCAAIRSYDLRFRVRPGLVGYSQLFTPHGTPKVIRSRIDNRFHSLRPSIPMTLALLTCTAVNVVRWTVAFGIRAVERTRRHMQGRLPRRERRIHTRVTVRDGHAAATGADYRAACSGPLRLLDISERTFQIRPEIPAGCPGNHMVLYGRFQRRGRTFTRRMHCRTHPLHTASSRPGGGQVMAYMPVTAYGRFVQQQYFLGHGFACRVRQAPRPEACAG